MFLIDTNVICEMQKGIRADTEVRSWFQNHAAHAHFVSVLTVGEMRRGVEQIRPRDPVRASVYEESLAEMTAIFEGRILGVGREEAEIWGRIGAAGGLTNVDGLIAATALAYGLTVVTRNVKDFQRSGVKLVNPWL